MSTWIIVTIIVVILLFIVSTMTALLNSKPIRIPEGYEGAKQNKEDAHDKDDDRSGSV
ncbi:MAG: hypothetical protein ACI97K_000976 [Glaciecola sp.]|jgi:hypothetical protein